MVAREAERPRAVSLAASHHMNSGVQQWLALHLAFSRVRVWCLLFFLLRWWFFWQLFLLQFHAAVAPSASFVCVCPLRVPY